MGCCNIKNQDQNNSITKIIVQLNNLEIKNASGKAKLINKVREEVVKCNYFLSQRAGTDNLSKKSKRSNSTQFLDEKEFKF